MRKIILMAVGLLASSGVANTFASSECALVVEDAARLVCYDSKYRPTEALSTPSAWKVDVSASRMDDSETVYLRVLSADRLSGGLGKGGPAELILRCHENTTVAYFKWGGHFLADIEGYGRVTYRLDSEQPQTMRMSESTDHSALGHWQGGAAIPFIKKIIGHDSMTVRITPYNESAMTVSFPVSGLGEAVKPLREACNW